MGAGTVTNKKLVVHVVPASTSIEEQHDDEIDGLVAGWSIDRDGAVDLFKGLCRASHGTEGGVLKSTIVSSRLWEYMVTGMSKDEPPGGHSCRWAGIDTVGVEVYKEVVWMPLVQVMVSRDYLGY